MGANHHKLLAVIAGLTFLTNVDANETLEQPQGQLVSHETAGLRVTCCGDVNDSKCFDCESCQNCCNTCLDWSGWYLGVHGGYAWGDVTFTETNPNLDVQTFNFDNGNVGLHLGRNFQRDNLVWGIEGDWTSMQLDSRVVVGNGNVIRALDMPWMATIRGRFGYATDCCLIYGTVGAGFMDTETFFDNPSPNPPVTQWSSDAFVAFGGGLETRLTRCWTGRIEYLYGDYEPSIGNHNGFDDEDSRISASGIHSIRFGITRYF